MSQRLAVQDATGVILDNPGYGKLIAWGTTVPSDADTGWAPGALFFHIDGSAGTLVYMNRGTKASCNFDIFVAENDTVAAMTVTALTATTLTPTSIAGGTFTSTLTLDNNVNIALGTGTGSKIGASTASKLGFYGATPVTQQSTTGTTGGMTDVGSTSTVFKDSTFTGGSGSTPYTVDDLVLALKNVGILAA